MNPDTGLNPLSFDLAAFLAAGSASSFSVYPFQFHWPLGDLSRLDLAQAMTQAQQELNKQEEWAPVEVHLKALPPQTLSTSAMEAMKAVGKRDVYPLLGLTIKVSWPVTCWRCLAFFIEPVAIDRVFVCVTDEADMLALDKVLEEDVLLISSNWDAVAAVEDELIMAFPYASRHAVCPQKEGKEKVDGDVEVNSSSSWAQSIRGLAQVWADRDSSSESS